MKLKPGKLYLTLSPEMSAGPVKDVDMDRALNARSGIGIVITKDMDPNEYLTLLRAALLALYRHQLMKLMDFHGLDLTAELDKLPELPPAVDLPEGEEYPES